MRAFDSHFLTALQHAQTVHAESIVKAKELQEDLDKRGAEITARSARRMRAEAGDDESTPVTKRQRSVATPVVAPPAASIKTDMMQQFTKYLEGASVLRAQEAENTRLRLLNESKQVENTNMMLKLAMLQFSGSSGVASQPSALSSALDAVATVTDTDNNVQ